MGIKYGLITFFSTVYSYSLVVSITVSANLES